MTRFEFMEIAGYEVSPSTYDEIIEPAYLISKLAKNDFVKSLDRQMIEFKPYDKIKKLAKKAFKECGTLNIDGYTNGIYKEIKTLKNETVQKYVLKQDKKMGCYYPSKLEVYWFDGTLKEVIELI